MTSGEDGLTIYRSSFNPSIEVERLLRQGKIISEIETPASMVERMVSALLAPEIDFGTSATEIQKLSGTFGQLLDSGHIVMSTPVMTNAGRYKNRPLSACTVPPVNLRRELAQAKNIINQCHQDGMGTGFDLSDTDSPVEVLKFLNLIAVEGEQSGREDRPVGNMATCSVSHPKIEEFIAAKVSADSRQEEWKFNLSVAVTRLFMDAVRNRRQWYFQNGNSIPAFYLMREIAVAAHACADPGLIDLERMQIDNPTPAIGQYVSTAPCAEVGLAPGETCQFGYLNLGKFLSWRDGKSSIDYKTLEFATRLLTRVLDNALEVSIGSYSTPESKRVMSAKRKIGVGICGLADMLAFMGLPYDSEEGRNVAQDIASFINYVSKLESVKLAKSRGSFSGILSPGCLHTCDPSFIERKYCSHSTRSVDAEEWRNLAKEIRKTRMLRHASTTAFPPTGRSGLVVEASTGIEPLFRLELFGKIHPALQPELSNMLNDKFAVALVTQSGTCQDLEEMPADKKRVFRTAIEISPNDHLLMAATLQQWVDESLSKTVNLPTSATVEDVTNIFLQGYQLGLKGITVYRDSSKNQQPRRLIK